MVIEKERKQYEEEKSISTENYYYHYEVENVVPRRRMKVFEPDWVFFEDYDDTGICLSVD